MLILILEGVLIGCLLGLTGAGGGILAVPALMVSQNWSVALAAPVGLLAVTLAALVGAIQGLINKTIRYKAAIWIALLSIPTAKYGIYLSHIISPVWLTLTFSMVMFYVAYRGFLGEPSELTHSVCQINQETGKFIWNMKTAAVLGGIGIISGLLTGLLGVGGGFVIVPALRKFTNLNMKSIIATSLLVIFCIGSISIFINVLNGFPYPKEISSIFIVSCIIGLLIGRLIINYLSAKMIKTIFSILVIIVALVLFISSLSELNFI
ncbi:MULTISPECIES: sulfite exporter TauE/SafE family protein [Providencia]|uniref:sulfite exporter TauE/SafE family protein n=1 Tax=Providencia TaxID=586 RepID=UPI001B38D9C5|nr:MULTISPECIES: sulfite exporter TauE/SafE family protein [Providencia]ELR5096247.1 sulfite exporter TauE/SafE family protein [Providencia rettgeri]EMA4780914.1 sulfite exporter TauE/SafE family protein [Providencia rettgeri]MBQ0438561.1 sulfite exporter TauE/SafE family protein [Providencia rettgeri]MCG9949695.1 sulfite exporter TauE/SafE family protein [Providencia rettgeri]HEM6923406.1 sulfite exporter TauE/SafE family protein [Providencia rettgeri]